MKNHSHLLATWILLCIGITGCAAPPPPAATSPAQLQSSAQDILSEAVYFNSLFEHCAALGGDTEIDAIDTQQNWLNANWPLIAAADIIYTEQQQTNSFQYANQTISPAAIHLVQEAREKAVNELSLDKRSPINKQKTCSFRLAKITPENIELAHKPSLAPAAAEILARKPSVTPPISPIPSLAGDINVNIPQGRSYYSIFKKLESECPTAYTLVIANNWPVETYANFCGDQYLEAIQCEWGKCAVKTL